MNAVAQAELAYLLVCHVLLCLTVYETESLAIAALDVERHGSLRNHVLAQELLQDVRSIVVLAIVDKLIRLATYHDSRVCSISNFSGTQKAGIPAILLFDACCILRL